MDFDCLGSDTGGGAVVGGLGEGGVPGSGPDVSGVREGAGAAVVAVAGGGEFEDFGGLEAVLGEEAREGAAGDASGDTPVVAVLERLAVEGCVADGGVVADD